MSNRVEWLHAGEAFEQPEVVSPDVIEEMADDGNEAGDWGVGAGGIMLYGTLEQLHAWLTSAVDDLEEPLRKSRNKAIKATRKADGAGKCPHSWVLIEEGYSRTWSTYVDDENKTIRAVFNGTADFSEEGSGEYLQCDNCGHVKLVPGDYEVEWL